MRSRSHYGFLPLWEAGDESASHRGRLKVKTYWRVDGIGAASARKRYWPEAGRTNCSSSAPGCSAAASGAQIIKVGTLLQGGCLRPERITWPQTATFGPGPQKASLIIKIPARRMPGPSGAIYSLLKARSRPARTIGQVEADNSACIRPSPSGPLAAAE